MKHAKFYLSDLHCCGHIRGEIIAREVNKEKSWMFDCKTSIMLSDISSSDVMVFQRQLAPASLSKMRYAQSRGVKCVYDIDDDLLSIPGSFAKARNFYNDPERRAIIITFLREADLITVSTESLALALRAHTDRPIAILPNGIDEDYWLKTSVREEGEDITIGWMASESHRADTPLIADAVREVLSSCERTKFHTIGWIGDDILHGLQKDYRDRVIIEEWVDIADLPRKMASFDIGLAPLLDINFNRCKSNIKFLQYSVLGAVTVASPIAPYAEIRHAYDGFLCDKADEWTATLKLLVDNEQQRKSVGKNAREMVLSKYNMKTTAERYVAAFNNLIGG